MAIEPGTVAICSQSMFGIITEPERQEITYPDGTKGEAYVGINLLTGKPWSSKSPCMVGRITPDLLAILQEFTSASAKYPPFNSLHEGYAVILEEMDELWGEIKKKSRDRDPANLREEAIQVAAMALRLLCDCIDDRRKK